VRGVYSVRRNFCLAYFPLMLRSKHKVISNRKCLLPLSYCQSVYIRITIFKFCEMQPNLFLKARTGFIEGLAYVDRDQDNIWKVTSFVSNKFNSRQASPLSTEQIQVIMIFFEAANRKTEQKQYYICQVSISKYVM